MTSREAAHILRVVRRDDATAESHAGRNHQRVDRHLAPSVGIREEMARDASHPGSCRDDLGESPNEDAVDRLVDTPPPIQLDKHRGRDPNRRVSSMGAPHRGANPLMPLAVLLRASERGDGLAIED